MKEDEKENKKKLPWGEYGKNKYSKFLKTLWISRHFYYLIQKYT